MSEGNEGWGERELFTDHCRGAINKKNKNKKKRERRVGQRQMHFFREHIISRLERGGGRRGRWRRDRPSSHNSSWPLLRHFSSALGSERAGGWCGQPLSDVDSIERSAYRQGAGHLSLTSKVYSL